MDQKQPPPNWLNRAVRALASSRMGARLLAPILHRLDRATLRLTGGQYTLSGLLAGIPTIILTTRGARSGKQRSVPLLGVPAGDEIVVIASNFGREQHPNWYYNVRANPEVEVRWDDGGGRYVAREATGAERDRYWQQAVADYRGFAAYQQRAGRQIPVIVLTPHRATEAISSQ